MKIYVFNPDHDLALACNEPHYMPPESVRCMASDLSLLPFWYADEGSWVWVSDGECMEYARQMSRIFDIKVETMTKPLNQVHSVTVVPWGWNPAFCKRMLHMGALAEDLPTAAWLFNYRCDSSRKTAVEILDELTRRPVLTGVTRWLTSLEDCIHFCEEWKTAVFKSPWSGSGKGLLWCRSTFGRQQQDWCAKVIREFGGVVASPIYNKVCDFAMEFHIDECAKVYFDGYSLFQTNSNGAYKGNFLLSDADIEKLLSQYISIDLLYEVRGLLINALRYRFSDYRGVLGVDMMIVVAPDGYELFPCVEVNLRMNMGAVSHTIFQRLVSPSSHGEFRIERFPTSSALSKQHQIDQKTAPLRVCGGRIVSGYLSLTPVTSNATYRAFVMIKDK